MEDKKNLEKNISSRISEKDYIALEIEIKKTGEKNISTLVRNLIKEHVCQIQKK